MQKNEKKNYPSKGYTKWEIIEMGWKCTCLLFMDIISCVVYVYNAMYTVHCTLVYALGLGNNMV